MEVVYPRCAGLDVHKKTVVACAITPNFKGGWDKEIATFSTMKARIAETVRLVATTAVYTSGNWIVPGSTGVECSIF